MRDRYNLAQPFGDNLFRRRSFLPPPLFVLRTGFDFLLIILGKIWWSSSIEVGKLMSSRYRLDIFRLMTVGQMLAD